MKRWLIYCLFGLGFGIADWYYLDALAHFPWGGLGESILVVPIIIALNYGIWLVPVVPIAFLETRTSMSIQYSVLAGVLTWSSAMMGYYAFYTGLLSLGLLPNLEGLNVLGQRGPNFWTEWWSVFDRVILSQFLEWIIIAIPAGGIAGGVINQVYRVWIRRSHVQP